MASPIWKAMWSAGTQTCMTVPFRFLTYSPDVLSGFGTRCPSFIYIALDNPAHTPPFSHCQQISCRPGGSQGPFFQGQEGVTSKIIGQAVMSTNKIFRLVTQHHGASYHTAVIAVAGLTSAVLSRACTAEVLAKCGTSPDKRCSAGPKSTKPLAWVGEVREALHL